MVVRIIRPVNGPGGKNLKIWYSRVMNTLDNKNIAPKKDNGLERPEIAKAYGNLLALARLAEQRGVNAPSYDENGKVSGQMYCLQDRNIDNGGYRIENITGQTNSVEERIGKELSYYTWVDNHVTLVLYEPKNGGKGAEPVLTIGFNRRGDVPKDSEQTLLIRIKPEMWGKYMPEYPYPQGASDAGFGEVLISDFRTLSQSDGAIVEFTNRVITDFGKHFGTQ